MTQILRIRINWTGFVGAPGYTNLHFRDFSEGDVTQAMADGAYQRTNDLISNLLQHLPPTVSIGVDPTVEIINVETGALEGFLTVAAAAPRVGTGAGGYSAASGAVINWQTGQVRNGRRVRGRTFLVPLAGVVFAADGTLDNTKLGQIRTAVTTFLAPGPQGVHGVWARPTETPAQQGFWAVTTGFTIPDKAAVLRSRRD